MSMDSKSVAESSCSMMDNVDTNSEDGSDSDSEKNVVRSYSFQTSLTESVVHVKSKVFSSASLKMIAATLCIIGAVAAWVTMAEALQKLNKNYYNRFFTSWFVQSFYSVLYIVWAAWRYFPFIPTLKDFKCNRIGEGYLPHSKKLIFWSGVLAVIYLVSGYAWYLSLPETNIPANTAIYQCSTAFVFVFSVPLLKERVTLVKIGCVLLSIGGVFMVAFFSHDLTHCIIPATNLTNSTVNESVLNYYSIGNSSDDDACDEPTEVNTAFGYIMLIVSVITYALFETLFKKFATAEDDKAASINSLRIVGYVGVCTLFLLWPPIIILHFSGYEVFELPPTTELLGLLFLNCALDIVFNSFLLVSIALSSPLYASIGSILTIPVSVLVDWAIQQFLPSALAFVGIALILSGFIGFVVSEALEIRRDSKQKEISTVRKDSVSSEASLDETELKLSKRKKSSKPTFRSRIIKFLI